MTAPPDLRRRLGRGLVIPAHPLALTSRRTLDERRQRALTRYYLASGVGGLAVGVHTTQFAIHDPKIGLYDPVLKLAMHEIQNTAPDIVKVAGILGRTTQALAEARLAAELGYECGLLSLGALQDCSDVELIEHVGGIAETIPVFGFYLYPAIGGRVLSYGFWRDFMEIENVVAIKVAPFDRYRTLDVVRALADSGRQGEISLYTGNDDNILLDLITPYRFAGQEQVLRIVGGLLGQWAVWTRRATEIFEELRDIAAHGDSVPSHWLELNGQLTDANAAIFDAANHFSGCLAGILEVLRRQGLLEGIWCLDPNEQLSPGQSEELDRVESAYPHLRDDSFVKEHLDEWLA